MVYSHNAYYVIGGYGHPTTEDSGSPITTVAKFASGTWSEGKKSSNTVFSK